MKKIQTVLLECIRILLLFAMCFVMMVLLVMDHHIEDPGFAYQLLMENRQIYLILFAAAVVLSYLFRRKSKKAEIRSQAAERFSPRWLIPAAVLFAVQLLLVSAIYFPIGFDIYYLKDAAAMYLNGGLNARYDVYFRVNPNNVVMFAINVLFTKIGSALGFDGYKLLMLLGILTLDGSIFLAMKLTFRLTGKKSMVWAVFLLTAVLLGLSPWIMAPYTDIFTTCVPVGTLTVYLKERDSSHKPWLKAVLTSLLPLFGMLLKPTCVIVLIAVLLIHILRSDSRGKKALGHALSYAAGIALVCLAVLGTRQIIYQALDYQVDDSMRKTAFHYLLLGSNTYFGGSYNPVDDDYTDSFPTVEEKNRADLELTKERYRSMTPGQLLYHFSKKADLNFNYGTLGWGKETNTAEQGIAESDSALGRFLQNLYYPNGDRVQPESCFGVGGKYFDYFALWAQFWWLIFMGLIFLGVILMVLPENASLPMDIMGLTMLGVGMFLMIFETNARYLINYIPLFATFAVCSFHLMLKGINHEK